MAECVKTTYSGRIATITLDNEKKLNSLTRDGFYAIAKAMTVIAEREDIFITVLTGKGRYFSAGADVAIGSRKPMFPDLYRDTLTGFVANNLNITRVFYSHPKILVVALNGPVVGLSAALAGFADFIYATPQTFLLTPFSSLGLVAEGGASYGLVQRLGIAKANEALIMSKRITCEELVQAGFVNKVFDVSTAAEFLKLVYKEIDDNLGEHLVGSSLAGIKKLIRAPQRDILDKQGALEVFAGLDRFVQDIPQKEFQKIASGQKRHKL